MRKYETAPVWESMLQHRYEEVCYSTGMRKYITAPVWESMGQHRYEVLCYSTGMRKYGTAPVWESMEQQIHFWTCSYWRSNIDWFILNSINRKRKLRPWFQIIYACKERSYINGERRECNLLPAVDSSEFGGRESCSTKCIWKFKQSSAVVARYTSFSVNRVGWTFFFNAAASMERAAHVEKLACGRTKTASCVESNRDFREVNWMYLYKNIQLLCRRFLCFDVLRS